MLCIREKENEEIQMAQPKLKLIFALFYNQASTLKCYLLRNREATLEKESRDILSDLGNISLLAFALYFADPGTRPKLAFWTTLIHTFEMIIAS